MTVASPLMTTEELLSLPDDGIERELIRGELKEKEMTRRGFPHTFTEASVVELLKAWLRKQPRPRGAVLSGDAGFRLERDPDTTVGIDVAYISAELVPPNPREVYLIDGAPVLAVEILSPSETQQDIFDKVSVYLDAGVKLVWLVEPVFKTVTVYRPDGPPVMFNSQQQLTAEPHLPGFAAPVAEVFGG